MSGQFSGADATERRPLPTLRSVSLRVHLLPGSLTWTLIERTQRGQDHWDRHKGGGTLRHPEQTGRLAGALDALHVALEDAYGRASIPPAEPGREPRGAVGGG